MLLKNEKGLEAATKYSNVSDLKESVPMSGKLTDKVGKTLVTFYSQEHLMRWLMDNGVYSKADFDQKGYQIVKSLDNADGPAGLNYHGTRIVEHAGQFCIYDAKSGDELDTAPTLLAAKAAVDRMIMHGAPLENAKESGAAKGNSAYGSRKNAIGPKVGDVIVFTRYGSARRKIHTVQGDYVEAGDVGLGMDELKIEAPGVWVYDGRVLGGIGS